MIRTPFSLAPDCLSQALSPIWAVRGGVHPHDLPDIAVGILDAASIHEAVILCRCARPVERRPDPSDHRGKLIARTEAGRRVADETICRHVANEERLLSVLTPTEQEMLNALLRKLIAGL